MINCYEQFPYLQVCLSGGEKVDIDYPDRYPNLTNQKEFIKTYMKGVSDIPSIIEGCLYTVSLLFCILSCADTEGMKNFRRRVIMIITLS